MPPPRCLRLIERSAWRGLLGSLFAASAIGAAGAAEPGGPAMALPAAHARVGFERVRFAGDDERTGLFGTSYLVDVGIPGLAIGPATYGAIEGRRGGFFALGGEAAWRQRLLGPFGLELGVFAGGAGGGPSALPAGRGSGLFLRPHADLVWDLGTIALGLSYSKVRFSGRQIDSQQLGLVLDINNDFRFVPARRLDEPLTGGGRSGLGFDRVQFSGGAYRLSHARTRSDGAPLPRTFSLVGVRAEQSWHGNLFWGLEASRAGRGDVGGYAELLGTVGTEKEVLRNTLTVGARIALGMAGGGGVPTGGGLLAKAGLYSILRLSGDLGLSLEAAYARAPDSGLRAVQGSAALVWALDGPTGGEAARPSRTEFSTGAARYDAPRSGGSTRALTAVVLKVDRYLTLGGRSNNLYVSGEALGAAGGAASGYSAGLVGVGWRQPLGEHLHVGGELLVGAAGGGGVDGRGTLLEPRVYAGVQLNPALSLRLGGGRVKALSGRLDSNLVDLTLNVAYGVAGGR